jgi:hypothetical protein
MLNNPDTRKVSMLEDLVKPLCLEPIWCLGGQATQGGQTSLKNIQFCILSLGFCSIKSSGQLSGAARLLKFRIVRTTLVSCLFVSIFYIHQSRRHYVQL